MSTNWSAILQRIKEHIWGPIGSMIFHGLLIAVLLTVAFKQSTPLPALPQHDAFVDIRPTDLLHLKPERTSATGETMVNIKPLDPGLALPPKPPDDNDFQLGGATLGNGGTGTEGLPGDRSGLFSNSGRGEGSGLDVFNPVQSLLILPGVGGGSYGHRTGSGKAGSLKLAGIWAQAVERAVLNALYWLKAAQNDDGSWGPDPQKPGDVARTGLALLTFLAHGDIPRSEEFGVTVEKGIAWLKSKQSATGHFDQNPYMHGIATYAICEAYGMTRIPGLKDVMDKATDVIVQGQQKPGGGWDYNYAKGARRDTSVSAWQVQALKAAVIAGCTVPGIKEALDLATKDLKGVQDPGTGRFGYDHRGGGSWAMTGAGVLCLQMLGYGSAAETQAGLKALQDFKPRWEEGGEWALYGMYYITQAKFQESVASFKAWNKIFAPMYCTHQNPDGSWSAMKKSNEDGQGAVYTTTLAALTLQVYYRNLPTYQGGGETPAIENASQPARTNAGDVVVRIM